MPQRAATRDEVCGPLGTPGGVAPALNAATDEQVATALRLTAHVVFPARWRDLASDAHALAAAHCLATTPGLELGPGGGDLDEEGGPLTSEADGPSSRGFGQWSTEAMSASDALWATTSYGRKFLSLRRVQRGFGSAMTSGGTASTWI